MSLNSDQLDAFLELAQSRNFSKAAKVLAISQPALSHRIRKLEESIKTSLFVRTPGGVLLTAAGMTLLNHCRLRRDLEQKLVEEMLSEGKTHSLSGVLRIAGFSTIMRSVVLPSLKDIVETSEQIRIEFLVRELHELPHLLGRGESDFVISNRPIDAANVESIRLGHETLIVVESNSRPVLYPDTYFDHDVHDETTSAFFKSQSKSTSYKRSFLDEIYTILDAVERGWGRAVVPVHLVAENPKFRVVKGYRSLKSEVWLAFQTQPYYLPLNLKIRELLTKHARGHLSQ